MMGTDGSCRSLVEAERRGDVLVLWMCDTPRRNALSVSLVEQLIEALKASRDEGVRGIVIASREKAFCAGADIRDMLDSGWLNASEGSTVSVTPPDLFQAVEEDGRPIVAAVDGIALGGGVELCLSCDLIIAGASASFAFPELSLGVLPNTAIARLPGLIGARAAADLILTRRRIGAEEALRLGLINTVVDGPGVVEIAVETVRSMVANVPPTALAAAKRQLRHGAEWPAIRSSLGAMDPEEWREGTTAFVEKRAANYDPFWFARAPSATGGEEKDGSGPRPIA